MRTARIILSCLLLFVMLPWGAYAGVAGGKRLILPAVSTISLAVQEPTALHDARHSAATAERRCRGPVLPGSPCAPDLGLLSDPLDVSFPGLFRFLADPQRLALTGRVLAGLPDPPRRR